MNFLTLISIYPKENRAGPINWRLRMSEYYRITLYDFLQEAAKNGYESRVILEGIKTVRELQERDPLYPIGYEPRTILSEKQPDGSYVREYVPAELKFHERDLARVIFDVDEFWDIISLGTLPSMYYRRFLTGVMEYLSSPDKLKELSSENP